MSDPPTPYFSNYGGKGVIVAQFSELPSLYVLILFYINSAEGRIKYKIILGFKRLR